MTPATIKRTPTATILRQIAANVRTLKQADGTALFGEVVLFDQDSLVEAFRWLHLAKQRVCIVVPEEEEFEQVAGNGTKLVLARKLPVMLLISDRVIGDRVTALYGDPDAQPPVYGAYGLQEEVFPVVTGVLVTAPYKVLCKPTSSAPVIVKDKQQQNLPGRSAVALQLHVRGGTIETNIGPGAVL